MLTAWQQMSSSVEMCIIQQMLCNSQECIARGCHMLLAAQEHANGTRLSRQNKNQSRGCSAYQQVMGALRLHTIPRDVRSPAHLS